MNKGNCKKCEFEEFRKKALEQRRLREFKENKHRILNSIIVTSETSVENIEKRNKFISAQYVCSVNLNKDIFNEINNTDNTRIKMLEVYIEKAKLNIIENLKENAYAIGANAVIGVKIEHTYNSLGTVNIISVLGTGTAVRIK